MTYKISKEFNLCYGHRVWVQRLNEDFCAAGDSACKCRHLHGHEGKLVVNLSAAMMDDRSMVIDFKEIGWLKDFIDNTLDHKFIIDKNDPMFKTLVEDFYFKASGNDELITKTIYIPGTKISCGEVALLSNINGTKNVPIDTPEYEVLEGYFIVDFVPTSEALSQWLFKVVKEKMFGQFPNVKIDSVEWHETPKSCAVYSE
jgi:6-pyruvoyltetrahydropterin/6-carboxytetrahydropterin synthase